MHPETIKTLLRLQKPSTLLQYLRNTRKLDPELEILVNTPQDESHHPEGNVFTHTCMVVDEAAVISCRENLDPFDHAVLVLSALTHDMGKATHTQLHADGRITSWGHAEAGIIPADAFLRRSKVNEMVINSVLPLVALHMAWVGFYTPDITSKSVRKIIRKVLPATLDMLALVVEADMSGRGGKYYKQGLPERMQQILEVSTTLGNPVDQYPDPLVSGDDIIELTGIAPSPLLGKVKAAMYKAQLEGRFTTREEGRFFLLRHVVIAEGK